MILCPKCRQPAVASGELTAEDGTVLPVFECENEACQVMFELGGEKFPATYTFAVTPDGTLFDPDEI
jgi:hypothetical protein